jgi:AcrR family transcriptional regulator
MEEDDAPRRRGRRPAGEDTRGAILEAARAEFAVRGYEGTTMRGIARAAGVDPRLVHHYFDSKEDVFVAALGLPMQPEAMLPQVLAGDPGAIGERVARFFFGVWDPPERRVVISGILRAAIGNEDVAKMFREFLSRAVFGRIAAAVALPDPELRALLAASQLLGIAVMRYVVPFEPVASADIDDLVPMVAPTLQRYLGG